MRLVMTHMMAVNIPEIRVPVIVTVRFIEKDGRRDRDNVIGGGCKVILDAMTNRGVIVNDGRKWVKDILPNTGTIDKENPRIEVEIVEVP